jgi:hypothetical protein
MAVEYTKELCIRKYAELKRRKNGEIPEYREYLRFASIPQGRLSRLFGSNAYSKLQIAAGDTPN